MNVNDIIVEFKKEFEPIIEKFEIIKVLDGNKIDYNFIYDLKKPSDDNNLIWHPGVYVFYGNGKVYRVGRHLTNSRLRVLQHIKYNSQNKEYKISDLNKFEDAEIILFNVKDQKDKHWVAAVEIFLEILLQPLIKAGRLG